MKSDRGRQPISRWILSGLIVLGVAILFLGVRRFLQGQAVRRDASAVGVETGRAGQEGPSPAERRPLLDLRVRWREDLEQFARADRKGTEFDIRFRLTWQFTIKDF